MSDAISMQGASLIVPSCVALNISPIAQGVSDAISIEGASLIVPSCVVKVNALNILP